MKKLIYFISFMLLTFVFIGCQSSQNNTSSISTENITLEELDTLNKQNVHQIDINDLLQIIQDTTFQNVILKQLDYEKINSTVVLVDKAFGSRSQITNNGNTETTQKILRYNIENTESFITITIGEILTTYPISNQYISVFSDAFVNDIGDKSDFSIYYDSTSRIFDNYVIEVIAFDPKGNLDIKTCIDFNETLTQTLLDIVK